MRRFVLNWTSCWTTLQFHYLSAAKVQKQIRRFCQNDPELRQCVSFLASLPGVGTITATHALARLGDWRQITECASDRWLPGSGLQRTLDRR